MGWVTFPYKPRAANRNLTLLLTFSVTDFATQNSR
jgi:hypothetical protein